MAPKRTVVVRILSGIGINVRILFKILKWINLFPCVRVTRRNPGHKRIRFQNVKISISFTSADNTEIDRMLHQQRIKLAAAALQKSDLNSGMTHREIGYSPGQPVIVGAVYAPDTDDSGIEPPDSGAPCLV